MGKAVISKRTDYADAGAMLGEKDAAEVAAMVVKYGQDRAMNAQSARQVQRVGKMRAAGITEVQIESWQIAHADAFEARLEEINTQAGPKMSRESSVAKL